ncbi:MFS transporter [Nocardiopsis sp. HNM0947]|uniref:MFS transporter n=1 Tax=Nocardiopsis coralli TaxID=2772213 RepID=A0ABR9P236_9ACTN|nr:MFS transporter [Nocardiopsis coralli]MBE2997903.1 MFS transporter [Nocardiopsis coralli]
MALDARSDPAPPPRPERTPPGNNNGRKAAAAAFLGSTLEYYDFFIYGTAAALVFPLLFFPQGDPLVGTISALATFGVAYVARPLGGLLLGHFGDRVGRKKVMVFTLLLMGVSSTAVGLLPTYAQIGALAPALLVLCRLGQGISAGGEVAGASTLTLEHAPAGRRGFFTSFTMSGCMAGIVLANLVFIPVAALPEEQLLTWGWRVPFLVSVVIFVLAHLVRTRLDEPEPLAKEKAEQNEARLPVAELLRTQPADVLRIAGASLFAMFQTIFMVFGLSYATSDAVGIPESTMLWVSVTANLVAIGFVPLAARISDAVGRRPVWIASAAGSSVLAWAYFWAISTGDVPLVFAVGILFGGVAYSGVNGLWPAFFSETFATRVRYTGFAVSSQVGFLLAGFAPAIGFAIMGEGTNGWIPVAVFSAACGLVSALAVLSARETHDVPLDRLGRPRSADRDGGTAVYAVLYTYAPDSSAARDLHRPAHKRYLDGLAAEGVNLCSGPFGPQETPGALLLLRARSAEEAVARTDGDPFRTEGLVSEVSAREWTPVLGRLARRM